MVDTNPNDRLAASERRLKEAEIETLALTLGPA